MFKTSIAREVWSKKYQYGNETPLGTQERIAKALASVEENQEFWYIKFLQTLLKINSEGNPIGLKCTPGGRITSNIGTDFKGASLLNCYISGPVRNATIYYERKVPNTDIVIPVKYESPDTGDNMTNIVLTLLEQALTLGSEGGWGINCSFIRPRGSLVKTIGVEHPGVIKFLEIFDKMAEVIVAGNNDGYNAPLKNLMTEAQLKELQNLWRSPRKKQSRKGAMMVCMDVSHPDIEEFVTAKQKGQILTKFNMSVLLTDEFLYAVENNEMFDLKFGGNVYKKIKARQLYDLIMSSTFNRNEPGVLFYDNMQKNNPLSYLGPVDATNPCVVGNTLVLTTIGWIKIQTLYNLYEENKTLPRIITRNKDGVLENSVLEKVLLTEKDSKLFKVLLENGEFLITNSKHKFYNCLYEEVSVANLFERFKDSLCSIKMISGSGTTNIIGVEELDYTEDVYDLTANPNYNFFSLLNKEEIIIQEKIIINEILKLDYFTVINTEEGQKFAYNLSEKDVIL